VTVSNAQQNKNIHSGPYEGNHCLREKVHIWLGSLHAADFIYWLCDDCVFVCLPENVACVHVGKSEDHFLFFLVIMVDEKFFGKNRCILGICFFI